MALFILGFLFYFPEKKDSNSIFRRPLLSPIEYVKPIEDSIKHKASSYRRHKEVTNNLNEHQRLKIVEEIFAISSLDINLNSLNYIIEEKLTHFLKFEFLGNDEVSKLTQKLKDKFNSNSIKESITKEFLSSLSSEQLQKISKAFNSPLFKKINKEKLSDYVFLMNENEWSDTLKTFPLKQKRRIILSQLDKVTKSSLVSTNLMISIYKDILLQMGKSILPQVTEELDLSNFDAIKSALLKEAHENIIESFHILFKEVSDEELTQYLTIVSSNPFKQLPALYLKGIDNYLKQQSQN